MPSSVLAPSPVDLTALAAIEKRVLWLATSMIHHANRVRPNVSGLKVGGHQASSASIATIMTSLWFEQLRPEDRVSVKPHASPVLHAIHYLLGELSDTQMTSLRQFGGIQSYPSRSKDPDPVDYSTGSVGIGATAPIWGAISRRYAATLSGDSPRGRQYSLVGDAELDEGAIWEALLDPHVPDLGEIVWIVDLNRQSLDRVVPNIAAGKIERMFAAAGWQVITVPFGARLEELFARPGGAQLRERILAMPNAEYQRLLRCSASEVRHRLPGTEDAIRALLSEVSDVELVETIRNLGGHDLAALREAFAAIDDDRPTVIIAYTIKGNGLPTAGHPQNHSSLLTHEQYAELAGTVGMDPSAPWQRFTEDSPEGQLCGGVGAHLRREPVVSSSPPAVPADFGRTPGGTGTTQAALGRVLLDLTRSARRWRGEWSRRALT